MYTWNRTWLIAHFESDVWNAACDRFADAMNQFRLRQGIESYKVSTDLASAVERYLALEAQFERLQSLLDLAHLMALPVTASILTYWESLTAEMIELSESFIPEVTGVPASVWQHPLLSQYQPWVASLLSVNLNVPPPVTAGLRRIGAEYLDQRQTLDGLSVHQCAQWVAERVELDGRHQNVPWSYALRCQDNGLVAKPYRPVTNQAHLYFKALAEALGQNRVSLAECRQEEDNRINQYHLTVDEALTLALLVAHRTSPLAEATLRRVIADKRLNLSTAPATIPLCVDTPYGSFIHAYFDGTVKSLMSLVHELGHAIHHSEHRVGPNANIPLSPLVCEQRAIAFERIFIDTLIDTAIPSALRAGLSYYREYQTIELGVRHAMLHAFEADLYRLPSVTANQISTAWMKHNRDFYGPAVRLEESMEPAWLDVQHLFTAPFYLQLYARVMELRP